MNVKENQEYLITIGGRLKGVRLLKGITQKQAAEDTGITQSFLSSVERGRKSACTPQIIALINYYKVPYELIFGEPREEYSMEHFPSFGSSDSELSLELLELLVGKAESADLIKGCENCTVLLAYVLFRTIYRENPRNSEKLFSISYEDALSAAERILTAAPKAISAFINANNLKSKHFELPPERNGELRQFIRYCETMLISDSRRSMEFSEKSSDK